MASAPFYWGRSAGRTGQSADLTGRAPAIVAAAGQSARCGGPNAGFGGQSAGGNAGARGAIRVFRELAPWFNPRSCVLCLPLPAQRLSG